MENDIEKLKELGPKTFASITEVRTFVLISTVATWALTKPIDPVTQAQLVPTSNLRKSDLGRTRAAVHRVRLPQATRASQLQGAPRLREGSRPEGSKGKDRILR